MNSLSCRSRMCRALVLSCAVIASAAAAQTNPPGTDSRRLPSPKQTAAQQVQPQQPSPGPPSTPAAPTYSYPTWFPLWASDNHTAEKMKYYFGQDRFATGSAANYQYNAQQSASIVDADLLTTWFSPGIEVVLAGSATSGSSSGTTTTTTTSGGSTSTTSASTDSVDTAVAKLENGGDFNLRAQLPLLWKPFSNNVGDVSGQFVPNLGFYVNGLSSQTTITDSTQYSFNLPVEFWGQWNSLSGAPVGAVFFVDVKPAGEFISKDLAAKLGPSVPRAMFLGQAAAGIEFAQKVRLSFQYVYGNASIYQSSASGSSTGGSSSTTPTEGVKGLHLVISFSPPK